jgi:iron(III) transport system permease protein
MRSVTNKPYRLVLVLGFIVTCWLSVNLLPLGPEGLTNSLGLAFWTCLFSFCLALLAVASLVFLDPPGKKIFLLCLPLPLGIPLYVMAYLYHAVFEYSSGLSTWLRVYTHFDLQTFIGFKSIPFVSLIYSFCLFPYLFLYFYPILEKFHQRYMILSESIDLAPNRYLSKVLIPMSAPWVLAALVLISLEVLADFGAASVFNLNTLTVQIYTAWTGLFSLGIAFKIAGVLLILSILLSSFYQSVSPNIAHDIGLPQERKRQCPRRLLRLLGLFVCMTILFFTFLLPIAYLIKHMLSEFIWANAITVLPHMLNSFMLALAVSLIVAITNGLFLFINRNRPYRFFQIFLIFSQFGYALPGMTLAIVFVFLSNWVQQILPFASITFFYFIFLLLALSLRFTSFMGNNVFSSFFSIKPEYAHLAENLNLSKTRYIKLILVPSLLPPILVSMYFVFLEVIKEMPLTLMLRPTHFHTLSSKIFELTSEGEWEKASIPAFLLICLSMIGQLLLMRKRIYAQRQ